jgi:hypothetical protein
MKRHVAATLLCVLGLLVIDSHVNWVPHDQGTLLEVSGQVFDTRGWASEQWRQWRSNCQELNGQKVPLQTSQAVLQTIQQHSLPDSLDAQLLQVRMQGDWAIAEIAFKTLNPSIVVLRQWGGVWHIQDTAVWSGSTAPWHAANFVRRYLRQQAPGLPEPLLACFTIDLARYGQGPGGLGPVNLGTKDRP